MTKAGPKEVLVSGIYQDITNGGRTAKAIFSENDNILWYVVSLDVKPGVSMKEKIIEYREASGQAKVTHLEGYVHETLGETIEQLKLLTILAIVIAIFVAILITSLFVKMLIAKDASQIAILKSIGFSFKNLQMQYITRILLVLGIGIIVGTILSNT